VSWIEDSLIVSVIIMLAQFLAAHRQEHDEIDNVEITKIIRIAILSGLIFIRVFN